jgi:CBS domain-containing protein
MITADQLNVHHFLSKKIEDLHIKPLTLYPKNIPVYQAAKIMAYNRVSCLFIGSIEKEIEGYITDITLRDKVIAAQLGYETPIADIMDSEIVSVNKSDFLYQALLLMFQTKTRYLLIKANDQYIGYVSRTKILTEQSNDPFLFVQSVKQSRTPDELKQKWEMVPQLISGLIKHGVKSAVINQIVSTVADTIAVRVIENVMGEIGPAPAQFIFFVLGSEGRSEMSLKTDQDNAIIYEDKANEQREIVRTYFLDFAEKVSYYLDAIGFSYCKGDLMAKNPKWTHSLSHWKRNYQNWIQESSQETLDKFATFFDCRGIYGDFTLLEELKKEMSIQLQNPSERFYVNLGQNALRYDAPLTLFKGIKTYKVEGEKVFNIKKAMTPLVDFVRIYALKNRVFATNTVERINALEQLGALDAKEVKELKYAYDFLMTLRLEKQAVQMMRYQHKPNNDISLEDLTQVQKKAIVEIFKVIQNFQLKIKIEFTKDVFS